MNRLRIALLICVSIALIPAYGVGHELQPGYLELRQVSSDTFNALWKLPARDNLRNIHPIFPPECKNATEPLRAQISGSFVERWTVQCRGGLFGKTISIDPDSAALLDVLVRVVRADGSTQVERLNPVKTSVMVEAAPNWVEQSGTYLKMGIDHILMGVDHLLFVLGLLLLVDNRWMLAKTITSFTIAHSITLAIASFGFASAPTLPLQASIALSILFLGPEVIRKERGETSLTIRNPWLVAFVFGLLHGFGFASGLNALGLSGAEIPLALLMFNIGVEIGQLFFVAIILLLERSFHTLEIHWPAWVEKLPAYTVGSLGAYWTIQRTLVMLGGL